MICMSLATLLPNDILRLIFEEAAIRDKKEALKLTTLCRLVQHW